MSAVPKAPRDDCKRLRIKPERVHVSSNPRGRPITMVQDAYIDLGPTVADIDIPISQRKTIMQLRTADCRWPVGDPHEPGFFYCGGAVAEGKPYCPHHWQRSFVKQVRQPRANHVGF